MSNFVLLGIQSLTYKFPVAKQSTRMMTVPLSPPDGTQQTLLMLQGFQYLYDGRRQYGFGELGLDLHLSGGGAACTASLRDDKADSRDWNANVIALAMFFGPSTQT